MSRTAPSPAEIGAFYDRFWTPDNESFQEEHDFQDFQRDVERALAWLLEQEGGLALKTVLEVGPGRGRDTEAFARAGGRVVALDVSPRSVEIARDRLRAAGFEDRIEGVVADAARMPFRDGAFDLTFSRFVIAHVDTDALGDELARVVKPGGRSVLVEPLSGNPLVKLYRRFSPTGCRDTSPRYVSLSQVRRMARGFPRGLRHREFYLWSVVALALRGMPIFGIVSRALQLLERPFAGLGPLRPFCWVIVAELRR